MPNIKETPDLPCVTCEWLAVFLCKPCDRYVCGKHRGAHYQHDLTAPPVKGVVKK